MKIVFLLRSGLLFQWEVVPAASKYKTVPRTSISQCSPIIKIKLQETSSSLEVQVPHVLSQMYNVSAAGVWSGRSL